MKKKVSHIAISSQRISCWTLKGTSSWSTSGLRNESRTVSTHLSISLIPLPADRLRIRRFRRFQQSRRIIVARSTSAASSMSAEDETRRDPKDRESKDSQRHLPHFRLLLLSHLQSNVAGLRERPRRSLTSWLAVALVRNHQDSFPHVLDLSLLLTCFLIQAKHTRFVAHQSIWHQKSFSRKAIPRLLTGGRLVF